MKVVRMKKYELARILLTENAQAFSVKTSIIEPLM
jgi:hypothetical protein